MQPTISAEVAMTLWNKLKVELDRAGRVAQGAFDEGKVRLEAFRARQRADKAAEALGYALYRARQGGGDLAAEAYARLSVDITTHEAEATRLEALIGKPGEARPPEAPRGAP
jgi:hypothetical protein